MRLNRKFLGGGIGLVVVAGAIVVIVLLQQPKLENTATSDVSVPESDTSSAVVSDVVPTAEIVEPVKELPEIPELPELAFVAGSVEEACEFNDFPPYHSSTFESDWDLRIPLASEECWSAMETHINTINPLHLDRVPKRRHTFQFFVLEDPLTFGRIFTDPTGDFSRVQDALSRPECLLTGDEANWELKDSCHAGAFLNFVLINRICLGSSGWSRAYTFYPNNNDLTPKQDRLMWKESLEHKWVEMKCEEIDQTLEFSSEQYPELHKLVMSLQRPTTRIKKNAEDLLIELAARLGDETAGLTQPSHFLFPHPGNKNEEGYKFGRFAELLASRTWQELSLKQVPNADRFFQIFHMLAKAESQKVETSKAIQFDWSKLVQHMCIPPSSKTLEYIREDGAVARLTEQDFEVLLKLEPEELRELELEPEVIEDFFEPKSCQEIVHVIRQEKGIQSPAVLAVLEKFEQVALELDVYD